MNVREKLVRSVLSLPAGLIVIPLVAMGGELVAGIFLHGHFREFGQATDALGGASLLAFGRLSFLLSGFVVGVVSGRYEVLYCVGFIALLIGLGVRWANLSFPNNDLNVAILAGLCENP